MGTMTLQNFRDDLASALGRTITTTFDRWINNAIFEFGYAFKFPELQKVGTIPTVQGQNSYSLPADFRAMDEQGVRIISPSNQFGGVLLKETRTQYLRQDRYASSAYQNVVGAYHMFQKKMWLRPAPNSAVATVEFEYWAKITPLTTAGSVSIFEDDWDDVIFRGALYRGYLAYGEHDRMINVFNLYLASVRSRVMAEELEEFPEGGISLIQNSIDNLRR